MARQVLAQMPDKEGGARLMDRLIHGGSVSVTVVISVNSIATGSAHRDGLTLVRAKPRGRSDRDDTV